MLENKDIFHGAGEGGLDSGPHEHIEKKEDDITRLRFDVEQRYRLDPIHQGWLHDFVKGEEGTLFLKDLDPNLPQRKFELLLEKYVESYRKRAA
ncbi:MAG TPA: hypothetical protein VEA18_00830 [Candidatus Kapabacteria bacterium]|nr:hypothetical protein [Candidatus Kapabacteria bacterium]